MIARLKLICNLILDVGEGEGFHHSANTDRHKSNAGTRVDDPPQGISVAVQTDTTTPEATVVTGNEGVKGNIPETIREGEL